MENLQMAAFDQDNTPQAGNCGRLRARYFSVQPPIRSARRQRTKRRDTQIVLKFTVGLKRFAGGRTEVDAGRWRDDFRGETARNYVNGVMEGGQELVM
jgi:hypothetical protein